MKTSEIAIKMKKYIGKLVSLFLNRNMEYADEGEWASNFNRNALYNEVFRIKEIIEQPYGVSLEYVLQKIDRIINGILIEKGKGEKEATHISDSIDDAIVYLFITRNLLIEAGLIEDKENE